MLETIMIWVNLIWTWLSTAIIIALIVARCRDAGRIAQLECDLEMAQDDATYRSRINEEDYQRLRAAFMVAIKEHATKRALEQRVN